MKEKEGLDQLLDILSWEFLFPNYFLTVVTLIYTGQFPDDSIFPPIYSALLADNEYKSRGTSRSKYACLRREPSGHKFTGSEISFIPSLDIRHLETVVICLVYVKINT